ncbi:MAG: ABC transporter permease subunit, partial [Microcoleus sp.]
LSVLVVASLLMFSAFTKDVKATHEIINNLPLAIRSALSISLGNFFTIYGFFAYQFTFVTLMGAIQAMNLGVGLISKEDSGKTTDFLLTKPISRVSVVTNKLLAGTLLLICTNGIFSATAAITAKTVSPDNFNFKTFLMISTTLLLVQLMFLALGMLFSVIIPKIKSVVTVTLPTVFTFFIIGTLGAIVGNDTVRYITPFKFFDPNYIISHGAYEMQFLIIEVVFLVVVIPTSYIIFIKKDIRAVS